MKKLLSMTLAVVMLFALTMPAFAALTADKEVTVTANLELPTIALEMPTALTIKMMPFAAGGKQIVSAEHKIVNLSSAPVEVAIFQAEITEGGKAVLGAENDAVAMSAKGGIVLNIEFGAKTALLANNPPNTLWPTAKYEDVYVPAAQTNPVIYNMSKAAVITGDAKKLATLARAENDEGKPLNWGTTGEDTLVFRFNGWMDSAYEWLAADALTNVKPTFKITTIANTIGLTKAEVLKPANTPATLLKAAKAGVDKAKIVLDAAPQKGEEIWLVDSTVTAVTSEAALTAVDGAKKRDLASSALNNVLTTFESTHLGNGGSYDPHAVDMKFKIVVVSTNAVTGAKTVTMGATIYSQPTT